MLMPHKVTVGVMENHFPIRDLLKQGGDKAMYIILGLAFMLMVLFCWVVQGWLAGRV